MDGVGAQVRTGMPVPQGARRWADWIEIARPFSLTASLVPVVTGGALAWQEGRLVPWAFAVALAAAVMVQVGTNIVNEVYDVAHGVDGPDSPRASRVVVQGRIAPSTALRGAAVAFAAAAMLGLALVWFRGLLMLLIGLVGIAAGYAYTGPPAHYKYRALGVPAVFVLMGPLHVLGAHLASAGTVSGRALLAGLPVGCLVAAILHSNDLRDLEEDSRGPFRTLTSLVGRPAAARVYAGLVVGAFGALLMLVAGGVLPWPALAAFATLPAAVSNVRRAMRGARGDRPALEWLDIATARLHLRFGLLMAAGVALGRVGPWAP